MPYNHRMQPTCQPLRVCHADDAGRWAMYESGFLQLNGAV